MNENYVERFSQRRPPPGDFHPQPNRQLGPRLELNVRIREYVKGIPILANAPSYIFQREIPTSDEISVPECEEAYEVPPNKVVGPWESKRKYLSDHYALLREDAVTPLRNVVSELKAEPHILEQDSAENAYVYEKVFVVGLTFAHSGVAAKVTFSLRRSGKKIIWEQSKRLLQGTLIALTPAHDMFKTVCKVGVVAARPLMGLNFNPPEIDIFFGGPDEIEVDPQQEWVMVESSTGYFEAYRHTLASLQRLAMEPFPLAEYIVGVERDIQPPWYLKQQPFKDLSSLNPNAGNEYSHVDILNGQWPVEPLSDLDASQSEALRRILEKELAIVQGPPGTGKTHVSVIALKVLLQNKLPHDPPIIVAAHTNHALDQLLRHIAPIEPEFIRLGSMTLDKEFIEPHTLFEVKQATKLGPVPGGLKGPAMGNMRKLIKEMQELLKPLTEGTPFSEDVFQAYGILTSEQCRLLLNGAERWVDLTLAETETAAISKWAGDELVQADRRTMPEDFGFEYEEMDLEFEQLKELEAEGNINSDDEHEGLRGDRIVFNEPWTGSERSGKSKDKLEPLLRLKDLWQVPAGTRGPLYRYMQQQVKEALVKKMRLLVKEYDKHAKDLKIGKWEVDTNFLRSSNIIGCTTTGLSKYRGLLQSLKPKIVLIEEAAETLEAYVTAACFDTLEHLILIGDHQQLRGHCNEKELEGKPWFLDVSMFERLVRNQVGFTQLIRQRRMHPEIRRGLMPIYPSLEDHPSVLAREPVPGMGDVRTFFFHHQWPEDTDELMSKINRTEAVTIVGFFNYLIMNGLKTKEITVLTFYNGQRKLILSGLRSHPNLQGEIFKVVTVDSYQGEENGVVLLSLVRSNQYNNIGFLSVANRVCVALSRAQRGFYIFGNARNLCKESLLWFKLVDAMRQNPRRVGFQLPLTCQKHGITMVVKDPDGFNNDAGGCDKDCHDDLPCGHACVLKCHPFPHDKVICHKPCIRELECGHACTEICHVDCKCPCDRRGRNQSIRPPVKFKPPHHPANVNTSPMHSQSRTRDTPAKTPRGSPTKTLTISPISLVDTSPAAQGFRDFAAGGYIQADEAAIEAAAKERLRRLDEENEALLFGDDHPDVDTVLTSRTNELKLTGTRQATDGTVRNTYEGFLTIPKAGESSGKQGPSLLD
ncbi:MAG: hypothetical protein LQ343_004897 [Gyalolechia ehrenbergii]|nr:MAG: hypothetical protein LQ343_004897 [Gyalolechia ehrenbergii]